MNRLTPMIDAHQHFWVYNDREYDWMAEDQEVLKRDHLPGELAGHMEAAGVIGTVAVQARRTLAETRWLLDLAKEHGFIRGVVGWVDFTSPRLEQNLERLSDDPKLVGVRELIHDMPDVDYAVSTVHVAGVRAAQRAGLTYDLLLRPQHLPAAIRLVDLLPQQRFVVDHIAKPDIAAGELEPWASRLRELARRENVWCKLSGLVTEADRHDWHAGGFQAYVDVVLDAFGTGRLMVGSDWPVCTVAAVYGTTIGLARRLLAGLSDDERAAVFVDNCQDFYRLTRGDT